MRFFLLLLLIATSPVFAQTNPLSGGSDKPVAIEADKELEWLRQENKFRATGNVIITQGDTTIKGDTAEAEYDPKEGPSSLNHMTVTGNVVITTGTNTIKAENATYDTRTEVLNLRGKQVTLNSPSGNVVSANGMDYFSKERKAVSKGRATVSKQADTLVADQVSAWMDEKNSLKRAEAHGNVTITQKAKDGTNIASAQNAVYDAVKSTAVLTGNVKLTQGQNHMQGDKATVNLATGYSSLQNNAQTGGRVRAIFTPKSDTSPTSAFISGAPDVQAKKQFEQPYAVSKQ